jgi:hypothetical protein
MKFLTKIINSEVLENNITYKKGNTVNNRILREKLLIEQKGFCAYTEEYLEANTLCPEVEHFNPDKKFNDDYHNYYVVSRYANQRKMKIDRSGEFKGESFFENSFFQNPAILNTKIIYQEGIYKQILEEDLEAKRFIDYMGFNESVIYSKRANSIRLLKNQIKDLSQDEIIEYLKTEDKDILSFPSAIEKEFNIDLTQIIK